MIRSSRADLVVLAAVFPDMVLLVTDLVEDLASEDPSLVPLSGTAAVVCKYCDKFICNTKAKVCAVN